MSGIYVHIPFCKQACFYCNFHFSTSPENKEPMVEALQAEIELQKDFFKQDESKNHGETIQTVYFGGGTPSLLDAENIDSLLGALRRHFRFFPKMEITLEANPDDISPSKLLSWKRAGINRLSIGVQSFYDKDLIWMNRSHDARQAKGSISEIKKAGFSNFSADLIFGIPGQTDIQWEKNIEQMILLDVPHLSCYALTLEPQTALWHLIQKKKYPPLSEAQAARQFEMLMRKLASAGYEQYEISNFSRPGYRSRHNSSYWKRIPYLGIGPSAHSFNGSVRQWNVSNNMRYMKSIGQGVIPAEREVLTKDMQWNEYIMTSLRMIEGCDLNYISSIYGKEAKDKLRDGCAAFLERGQMILRDDHLLLTEKGRLFADGIASSLFR